MADGFDQCCQVSVAAGFTVVCCTEQGSDGQKVQTIPRFGPVKALGGKDATERVVDVNQLKVRQSDAGLLSQTRGYVFPGTFVSVIVDARKFGDAELTMLVDETCFRARSSESRRVFCESLETSG